MIELLIIYNSGLTIFLTTIQIMKNKLPTLVVEVVHKADMPISDTGLPIPSGRRILLSGFPITKMVMEVAWELNGKHTAVTFSGYDEDIKFDCASWSMHPCINA